MNDSCGAHHRGTCRMGTDPATAVVDRDHRAHDVPNLFIVAASNVVSGGRNRPTMTIQPLAFRATGHIARAARTGLMTRLSSSLRARLRRQRFDQVSVRRWRECDPFTELSSQAVGPDPPRTPRPSRRSGAA